jgi:transposase
MRPHGSPADLEARRRRAVALLDKGLGVREVARQIGCSPMSVSRWRAEVRARGPDALRPKPARGRPPRVTARQRAKLLTLLLKGATAHGFSTDLWTLPRVAEVIARTFGVRYHSAHVWKILRGEGWSCQKPERRARERDEAAIQRWRTERWPHIKKRPPRRPKSRLPG